MKTRKSLLISSVAMLLVAMLALGTATFAWFTTDTTAKATNISVKTTKVSELQLSRAAMYDADGDGKLDTDWSDSIDYQTPDKTLKPVSSADGVNWFNATAEKSSNYAAEAGSVEKLTEKSNFVFADQLNVRNNGTLTVENVKIDFSLAETEAVLGKYLRLALVEVTARGENVTTFAASDAGDFTKNVYCATAQADGTTGKFDTAEAIKSIDGGKVTYATIDAKNGTDVTVDVGTLVGKNAETGTKVKYYNLYIWFEGQDTDCFNTNAGNYLPEINFEVYGDPVAAE